MFDRITQLNRQREDTTRRQGSPTYQYIPAALAAAASVSIAMEQQFPTARKYFPLDYLEIINNETVNDLTVVINGTESFSIPAGIIKTLAKTHAFWHVRITNNGALITTLGKVVLTFKRAARDADDLARGS